MRLALENLDKKCAVRIPYSVVLLVIGGVLGLISYQDPDRTQSDRWSISVGTWTHMDPRLILFIFLPALIFEGAMSTDYYVFRHQFPGGMTMAFPGMLLQVVLIALVGMYVFPYGWGWAESLMFGAMYALRLSRSQ